MLKDTAENLFKQSLENAYPEIYLDVICETPKNPEHGDFSVNIAMQLAKPLGMPPRKIAEKIIEGLNDDLQIIEKVEIAGPGFINIKFKNDFVAGSLSYIIDLDKEFGRSDIGKSQKVNVEYVSANPTGLLHLGHGRNAVIGDTISNLYEALGYDVTREYYFNNAGNQMNNLAKSIFARYNQINTPDFPFPEDGYHGDYIKLIAEDLKKEYPEGFPGSESEVLELCRLSGEKWCFAKITSTLERMKISQDVFYNEDTLYKDGKIEEVISEFKSLGLAYEKDGALWLKLSEMGLEDDRVIVKSSGEPTYRLPDIAYHREKFKRGFDILIDVFGADHIATVPDVLAGVKALGYDSDKVKVLIHQFVSLTENGQQVKMSKRTGKSYTLDDLLDEVGEDVVRFFLLMRSIGTHLEFDLSLAREQSDKNPVFYLQYAHARICSVFDKAAELQNIEYDLSLLNSPEELNLIKKLHLLPDTIIASANKFEPQILAEYLRETAGLFHAFYHNHRIIGVDEKLGASRLKLAKATKTVIGNGLRILGINAPERM
ncbi:MAG: arginine--tRNA ligase [Candidatus Kapabacteria bacterium]|nr:arginine--tRNA ligase [Ignavibacteriota bacterium]MCW5885233.1 arginine--tRNA ligase [Candidatus Kapabacteria bacterium]